jgi:hypothetical protein
MDNQTNNQEPISETPVNQEPVNQEPVNQEPVNQEPIAETPVVPAPPAPEPTLRDFGITPKPPQNNIFKIIFIFSLIIFILTASAFAFVYYKSQKKSSPTDNSPSTISSTPTPSGTCFLNDKTYQVGESFASADGCNTCSCQSQDMIACTEKACLSTDSATSSSTLRDWQTYTDSTYKYSISYPSTLNLNNESNEKISFSIKNISKEINPIAITPGLSIKVYKAVSLLPNNDKNLKFEDWIKQQLSTNLFSNNKTIKIDSITAHQVTGKGESDTQVIYIPKNNYIYEISIGSENISELDQSIINTFKFN